MTQSASKSAAKPRPRPRPKAHYEFESHSYPIRIVFAPDAASWDWLLKEVAPDEPYPTTHGRVTIFTHPQKLALSVITFSEEASNRPALEVVGLMAHEVTHVTQHIEEVIGCRLDSETQAYLTQGILQWLMTSYADSGRSFQDNPLHPQSTPK